MATPWAEPQSKALEPHIFNEEPSLQMFVSEDSKSASRKSHDPSPRSEPPSEIMLINSASVLQPAQLSQYKILAPFHVSISKIFEVFEKTSAAKNFQVIEQGGVIATAVHKERMKFKDFLLCCFHKTDCEIKNMTAVRLHIGINEKKCTRTVLLKGIYGNETIIKSFITTFRGRLEPLLNVNGEQQMQHAPAPHDGQYEFLTSEKIAEDEENGFTIKNESASYYQFHKILSSESYTLGQTIANFISSFSAQYRNVEESSLLLPQPVYLTQMDSVKLLIEDTVEALFSHFNFGKSNTERMMHYCRPAVEKFLFAKLLPQLLSIYRYKHREIDERFHRKRNILRSLGVRDLMEQLEVNPTQIKQKMRLVDLQNPYKEAIEVLAKLKDFITPVEKLNCLLTAMSAMKTAVVDYWHGKEELETMDDQLPVLILVLSLSSIESPMSEVRFLQDYIGQATRYENESQLLTNFEVSVRYIADEWQPLHES